MFGKEILKKFFFNSKEIYNTYLGQSDIEYLAQLQDLSLIIKLYIPKLYTVKALSKDNDVIFKQTYNEFINVLNSSFDEEE